jgi:putative transposase
MELRRCDENFRRHVEYCGLASRVRDWLHSSFHRDERTGLFPEDWAGDVSAAGSFGERV